MQSQAFAAAVRQAPRRILRVWLQPYSLGHEILLLAESNPLVCEPDYFSALPAEDRFFAIIRAVQICSRTWAENRRRDRNMSLWSWMIRKDDKLAACIEFMAYRAAGSSMPKMMPSTSNECDRPGSPFTARLMAYGASIFGESAFDKPLGMLQWLYFAQAEYDGGCKVKNAFQLQIEEEVLKAKEDVAREQKEAQCRP